MKNKTSIWRLILTLAVVLQACTPSDDVADNSADAGVDRGDRDTVGGDVEADRTDAAVGDSLHLAFLVEPGEAVVGQTWPEFSVELRDELGNRADAHGVEVTLAITTGTGEFASGATVSSDAGLGTF